MKTYTAKTMRKAFQQIQDELGSDAIIFSTKSTADGVIVEAGAYSPTQTSDHANQEILQELCSEVQKLKSIVTATPIQTMGPVTPLSPAPNNETKNKNPCHQKILEQLQASGFGHDYCQNIVEKLIESNNVDSAMMEASQLIGKDILVADNEIIDHQGAVALVGASGVGKTTTIGKLAARFLTYYGKDDICLISSDYYRIGGREQLRIYSKILDIPVHMVTNVQDLEASLHQLKNKRLVLIDTAGISPQDIRLTQKLNLFTHINIPLKTYLVFPTNYHEKVISNTIDAFRQAKLTGAIITKLDEYSQVGHALSACINKKLPINYLTMGQNVPGDLKIAQRENLLRRSLPLEATTRELAHA